MVFWIAVAVLAAAVTYAVTRPLLGDATARDDAAEADMAVYKDQLREIETDAERGTLTAAEAEAARTEVARRLIRRSEMPDSVSDRVSDRVSDHVPVSGDAAAPAPGPAVLKPLYAAMSIVLPAASLGLYLMFGAPGQPGQPLSDRIAAPVDRSNTSDLVAKVEARLREHPEDGKGWDVIAPVYLAQGKYQDAASAYATALRLLGNSIARLQGFADARIRAGNGIIADDAKAALEAVLALEPKRREPRIWLALAKEQDGNLAGAASDYRALIAEAPAEATWRKAIEDRLAAIEGGPKVQAPSSSQGPESQSEAASGGKGPQASDIAAAEAMSPDERAAMITKMVDNLAARLKTNGKDFAGWSKLIRAYQLMGRKDDAIKAFAEARAQLAGDDGAQKALTDLAARLGLNG